MTVGRVKSFPYPERIDSFPSTEDYLKKLYRSLTEEQVEKITDFEDMDMDEATIGDLIIVSSINPSADATVDLGAVGATDYRFRHLYLSGNLSDETNTLTVANAKDAYDKRVDTWGDGLQYSSQTASVDYNTTNLKITSTEINTIQDIATTSNVQFANVTVDTLVSSADNTAEIDMEDTTDAFLFKPGYDATDKSIVMKSVDNTVASPQFYPSTDGYGQLGLTGSRWAKLFVNEVTLTNAVTEFSTDGTMGDNSNSAVPTEAAVVTYVAAQITAEDLDFGGDAGTGAIDLDSQTLTIAGTDPIDTAASSQTLTISHKTTNGYKHIPSTGASTQILQYSAAGTAKWVTVSSDVSIADNGAMTVANDSHTHNTQYYTESEINTWRASCTSTEMGHLYGVTSDIQTQFSGKQPLDIELTAIASLTSAADRYIRFTGSGAADLRTYANVLSDLSGQAGAAFSWNSQNLTSVGTLGCGVLTSGNIIIPDAGNIGSTSDTDAVAIAAGGEVTLSQTLVLSDVIDAGTSTGKFLVLDGSNNVDYRTDAEVLADLSSDAGASFGWNTQSLTSINDVGCATVTATGAISDGASSTFTTGATIGNLTLANGSIIDSGGAISFGNENLSTTGTLGCNDINSTGNITIQTDGPTKLFTCSAHGHVALWDPVPGGDFYRSRGTAASPTAAINNDYVSAQQFWAYDGGAYRAIGAFYCNVDSTPASDDIAGRYTFYTRPPGSGASSIARMRIDGYGNVGINQTVFGTNAAPVLAMGNGTAPSTSPANAFQMYSADQVGGNACLHTRTENGAVIKLYQCAKADYNNWTDFGDVVDALVAMGIFDGA